ncbi:transposase [Mycolicibacterium moriokaense]|uniref:transposase n=1 Tax=Mycolicibacterium moriokaense TaxID=39691 RepID=UPI003C6E12E1
MVGCGPLTAARIVGETVQVRRFRAKDAFARLNGTAALPEWSSNNPPAIPITGSISGT